MGALHELVDQSGVLKSVVKWHRYIRRVSEIPEVISEAIHYMNSGRPGPTTVEIPLDVLAQSDDVKILPSGDSTPLSPDSTAIGRAAKVLANSTNPVIWAGGGVVAGKASAELIRIAETLGAPVLTTVSGKGAMPESHPLAVGCRWRGDRQLDSFLEHADVALVLGSQLSARHTDNWALPMPKTLIQVDIHSGNLGRHYPTVRGIHAHVRPALTILDELIRGYSTTNLEIVYKRIETARKAVVDCADKQHLDILGAIRNALPDDGMLFNDMTTVCYSGPTLFSVDLPRTFFCPNYVGTLGFSFPAALGAKMAEPGKSVVSLIGDGGFMFTSQELSTAVQQQICLPVVVFNDQAYSQLERFFVKSHGRSDPFQLVGPDLKTYARAFGVPSSRVTSPGGLSSALTRALDRHGPTVIEYALRPTQ